jgi:hypothetical protein
MKSIVGFWRATKDPIELVAEAATTFVPMKAS